LKTRLFSRYRWNLTIGTLTSSLRKKGSSIRS